MLLERYQGVALLRSFSSANRNRSILDILDMLDYNRYDTLELRTLHYNSYETRDGVKEHLFRVKL